MESARSRAKWLSEDQRTLTTVPPTSWERDESLDELLDHRAWMASVHEQAEREGDPDIRDIIAW